jgi:hypothetical protein
MRAVLKNHAHQKISAIKPMVLSINFIFKTEVEGHYPQENSFRHTIAHNSTESTLMLQTYSVEKRIRVCQMLPRAGSERMKRT